MYVRAECLETEIGPLASIVQLKNLTGKSVTHEWG